MVPIRPAAALITPGAILALALPGVASAIPGNSWSASDPAACGTPDNTFTVPAGVTQVHATVLGADGGRGIVLVGGNGAAIEADVPVTPGETLKACVGIGGGAGGAGSAGGGFASLSRANLADLIVLAGGGGGSGGMGIGIVSGVGGLATLPNGTPTSAGSMGAASGGVGATASAGGAGGSNTGDSTANGHTGFAKQGGAGGIGANGGGGGGGLYGGGGGAGHHDPMFGGAGGGGGSSFCATDCDATWRSTTIGVTPLAEVTLTWVAKPGLSVTGSGDFGSVPVNQSVVRTFTVKNTGSAAMTFQKTAIAGGDGQFGFSLLGCKGSLDVGAECTLEVMHTPSTTGAHTATLLVTGKDVADATIALTSTATAAPVDPPAPTDTSNGGETAAAPPSACVSRRVVTVSVPRKYRRALVGATAQISGKTVARFSRGKAQVDLRGRLAGTVKVSLVFKLRGGKQRTVVRTYTTCNAGKKQAA